MENFTDCSSHATRRHKGATKMGTVRCTYGTISYLFFRTSYPSLFFMCIYCTDRFVVHTTLCRSKCPRSLKLRPHRALLKPRKLRTEICVVNHIVNKRRYFSVRIANIAYVALCVASRIVNKRRHFSVRIANIAYVACVAYVATCVAAA
jgi:hypothetical protein